MNLERIRGIANTVLYEGYILYPYRATAIKNQQRWTFGSVFPRAFGGAQGDSATMQTQVPVEAGASAALAVHVRFLHLCAREIGTLGAPVAPLPQDGKPDVTLVPRLEIGGQQYLAWEEAVEREIAVPVSKLERLHEEPVRLPFSFAGERTLEPIRDGDDQIIAVIMRTRLPIDGVITVAADRIGGNLSRITVEIENVSPLSPAECQDRNKAQRRAFASTHTILAIDGGAFVSLLDPPEGRAEAAAGCENRGTWPVLVGMEGERRAMLSSPIILYDYPKIAPESAGDLFDATEIDEILTLRILAMTDAEKREMASVDARARALLERTHAMTPEGMAHLHGTFRATDATGAAIGALEGAQPTDHGSPLVSLLKGTPDLVPGSRVRLRPRPRGDIMDLVLKDQIAVIEAVECDFEDRLHVAVTLLDDPGRDLGAAGFPGHRFYFAQDEIELLGTGGEA